MAQGPINYLGNQNVDLGQKLLGGLQIGQAFSNIREKKALQEQAQQQKAQYRSDLENAFNLGTPRAFAELTAKYPGQKDAFKQSFDLLSEEGKKAELSTTMRVYSALESGNNEVAKSVLDKQIEALQNSGQDATNLVNIREAIDTNPKGVANFAGLTLASLMGKEQFAKVTESLGKESRAEEEQPLVLKKLKAETSKVFSDMKLNKANIGKAVAETKKAYAVVNKTNVEAQSVMRDIIQKKADYIKSRNEGIKLTPQGEKLLNDSVTSASNSLSLAGQYESLANEIENEIKSTGAIGAGKEAVKKIWGSQDRVTKLRQEYLRLKNSGVLNMLPPGPATDKDIEIAQAAFPDADSDPKFIASFMKGLGKLQRYDSQINETKADWINSNGNLGRARKGISIRGEDVASGTSFNEFIREKLKTPNVTAEEVAETETQPAQEIKVINGRTIAKVTSADGTITYEER